MSDKSAIEWTEATWNPVTGCSKVSQGCKHCYAEREWKRISAPRNRCKPNRYTGRGFTDVACHEDLLDKPLRWRRPRRIFVNSMSDLFHESVPDDFIDRVFAVMALCPHHVFQILTKRPERMRQYMTESDGFGRWGFIGGRARQILRKFNGREIPTGKILLGPLPHVWLGISCEDQATADERIPLLLQTPAAVRWVSAEPLLGDIRFGSWLECSPSTAFKDGKITPDMPAWTRIGSTALDWIVTGGESGPQARPMHPDWVRSIRDQCQAAGVPFFFKQWGNWLPGDQEEDGQFASGENDCPDYEWDKTTFGYSLWVGKKAAGRTLDGRIWNEYPA